MRAGFFPEITRMATVTLHGDTIQLEGELPAVGAAAPDFRLVDRDLNDVDLGTFGDSTP